MREKILEKAAEKFLAFGVNSVTMDEIAGTLGISKKTLYAHFSSKSELIEATAFFVFEEIRQGIEQIRSRKMNSIEEHFVIKDFVLENLLNETSSPQFQLQKYYPKIYKAVKQKQQQLLLHLITENLETGIRDGFYRNDILIPFVCRIYSVGMIGIKDRDFFPEKEFSSKKLVDKHLEYHLRAIVTDKGFEILKKIITGKE